MMAGFMSYFGGRRDPKQSSRDAIVNLRQQLQMVEKKEEHLQKKIDEEMKKAKANAVSNKAGASPRPSPLSFSVWGVLNEVMGVCSGDGGAEAQEGDGAGARAAAGHAVSA